MNVKIELSEVTTRQIKEYKYVMYVGGNEYLIEFDEREANSMTNICVYMLLTGTGRHKSYMLVEGSERNEVIKIFLKAKKK